MIFPNDCNEALELLGMVPGKLYEKEDVKRAYHRMALRHHPDKNPDEKEQAEATFKKIGAAHAKLNEAIDRGGSFPYCAMCGGGHHMAECDRLFSEWNPFGTGSASAGPTSPASPCTYCGKRGHRVEDCRIKARDSTTCVHCRLHGRPYNHQIENCYHVNPCEICGKTGHSTAHCRYRGVPKCDHCGDFGHRAERCFKFHPKLVPTCGRCGMRGHTSNRCYQ